MAKNRAILEVTNDHAVPFVVPGPGSFTVTNVSGNTLFYNDDAQVSSVRNLGSITAGSSQTFTIPMWLKSAGLSVVTLDRTPSGIDWNDSGAPVVGPSSSRNAALRDFVSALDYGPLGSWDMTSTLLTATTDARSRGKKLYMPGGTYTVSGAITDGSLAASTLLDIEGEDPNTTVLKQSASFPATAIINASGGGLGNAISVTSPSSVGATQLTITSTSTLSAGDTVLLRDSTQTIVGNTGSGSPGTCSLAGEFALIKSIDSITQFTVYGRLEFGYTTSADVRKMLSPLKGRIANVGFLNNAPGTQAGTARGITLNYCRDFAFDRLSFTDMDASCITTQWMVDWAVTHPHFTQTHDLETANTPYCIEASKANQHGVVIGARSWYGRHVFTTGGVAATEVGQSHILLADGIARNHSQAAWDIHPGARRVTFQDLQTYNSYPGTSAIQVRGPDCEVINPVVDQCDYGVQLIYGADRARVRGGRISGTIHAINIESSDDTYVGGGILLDQPTTDGILTSVDAGWTMSVGVALGELVITGSPSNAINNGAACPITFTG